MWSRRSVILLVTLSCSVAVLTFGQTVTKDRVTEYRIRSQNLHIDELEEEVDKLEKAFDKLTPDTNERETSRVRARVRRLEGDSCGKNEVSCGGDYPECVHNLLVCDGIKDCHNGRDEDEKICNAAVVHPGSTFSGITHWTSCTELNDHPTLITITDSDKSAFFGPRVFVRATVTNEIGQNQEVSTYNAKGYFSFAKRRLSLVPDANAPNNYGIICLFYFGDNDHADCRFVLEGTEGQCAKLRVTRA
jgi:hypothetical protein